MAPSHSLYNDPLALNSPPHRCPFLLLFNRHCKMDFLGKMDEVRNSEQIQSQGLQLLSNTALLAAVEPDDHNSLSRQIENQRAEVDQLISLHHDSLRRTLVGTLHRAAEETVAKVLRDKELELEAKYARTIKIEKMMNEYKYEEEWLKREVNNLEGEIKTLQLRLEGVERERRCAAYAAKIEDDAESSFADPSLVEPVRLVCKVCDRRLAAVVVWPCRHACVCKECGEAVKVCPVCGAKKTSTVELRLPLD